MKLREDGLVWQEVDGELVILDLDKSAYLTTNASGALLAKELTQERTPDELAATLVDEFGIDADQARQDTEAFLSVLVEKRLLA